MTDNHGDYSCEVIQGGDYRILPSKSENDSCGVTSLDLTIIRNHLLGTNCTVMTANWQYIAADANLNGTISTLDMVDIQKIILGQPHTVPSWRFVPTTTYGLMSPPSGCQTSVPSFNPYIDLYDVNSNSLYNDFIGVKMGDVNGSCTNCNGDAFMLNPPAAMIGKEISDGSWEFYTDKLVPGLAVWEVVLNIDDADENEIEITTELSGNINYSIRQDRLMIHYYNLLPGGETVLPGIPFFHVTFKQKGTLLDIDSGLFMGEEYSLTEIADGRLFPSSTGQHSFAQNKQLYPNPAMNGELFFEWTEKTNVPVRLLFYSGYGVLCLEELISQRTNGQCRIDASRLVPGIYFWQAHSATGILQQGKVVIQ